jgi:GntR family transcriptional repressor for pyruvate dehydrogenase complex
VTPTEKASGDGSAIRFEGVGSRKLSSLLVDAITEKILREGLKPGARLPPEREMQEQFEVGRGTLREALRVLEAEGLVTVRPGAKGGPVVAEPDSDRLTRLLILLLIAWGATLRDVYDARIAVEPLTARKAAESATPEQVEAMRQSVAALEAGVESEDSVIEENQNFHGLIGKASGNPVLIAISMSLVKIFDGYAMGTHFDPPARRQVVKFHAAIVDAIGAGDANAAERATLDHIEDSIAFLEKRFPKLLDEPLKPTLLNLRAG